MSDWRWGLDGEDARSVACPFCGAGVGEMCVSSSGRTSSNYHGERFAANENESDPLCRYCRLPRSQHQGAGRDAVCP
jgi:hypothetical protein